MDPNEFGKLAVSLICLFVGIAVLVAALHIGSIVLGLQGILIVSMAICGLLGVKFE